MSQLTPSKAKKIIAEALFENGLGAHKLTAKTVSFIDLARDKCIFVTVHDWQPDPLAHVLEKIAFRYDFCVQFEFEQSPAWTKE